MNLTQESESESKLKTVVFYFHTITSDFNQFVSCGLAEKSRNQFSAELKREKIICMKVKVEWIHPYCSICVVLGDLSSVLDEESVDLKVLVQMQINQIQKESL